MQHRTPEYRLINPFEKVPAIEHNGFKVIERYVQSLSYNLHKTISINRGE